MTGAALNEEPLDTKSHRRSSTAADVMGRRARRDQTQKYFSFLTYHGGSERHRHLEPKRGTLSRCKPLKKERKENTRDSSLVFMPTLEVTLPKVILLFKADVLNDDCSHSVLASPLHFEATSLAILFRPKEKIRCQM